MNREWLFYDHRALAQRMIQRVPVRRSLPRRTPGQVVRQRLPAAWREPPCRPDAGPGQIRLHHRPLYVEELSHRLLELGMHLGPHSIGFMSPFQRFGLLCIGNGYGRCDNRRHDRRVRWLSNRNRLSFNRRVTVFTGRGYVRRHDRRAGDRRDFVGRQCNRRFCSVRGHKASQRRRGARFFVCRPNRRAVELPHVSGNTCPRGGDELRKSSTAKVRPSYSRSASTGVHGAAQRHPGHASIASRHDCRACVGIAR